MITRAERTAQLQDIVERMNDTATTHRLRLFSILPEDADTADSDIFGADAADLIKSFADVEFHEAQEGNETTVTALVPVPWYGADVAGVHLGCLVTSTAGASVAVNIVTLFPEPITLSEDDDMILVTPRFRMTAAGILTMELLVIQS